MMKMVYRHDGVMPSLILSGPELAAHGFTADTAVRILLQDNALWITPVYDAAFFTALLNNPDADVTADMMQEDGSLMLAGEWLTTLGISRDTRLAVVIEKDVIRLRVPEDDMIFDA